jgi:hypothetical protein
MLTVNSCDISGNSGGGGVFNSGTLRVSGSTINGNAGPGIDNTGSLTISGCAIDGNKNGGFGGGILNGGTLTANACTIAGNTAGYGGGGVYAYGTVTLTNCTLSNNRVLNGDQQFIHYGGGGLYAGGTVALTNCTLANNVVPGSGGGLFVRGSVNLTNCTLSGNSAGFGVNASDGGYGGGMYSLGSLSRGLSLTNTIVAGNSVKQSLSGGPDIYGAVATADYDLVGNATGSSGIVNGVNGNLAGGNGKPVINADLGPLQNNGGRTQTMALLAGSPAIGHTDKNKAPATDQRGVTRLDEAGETTDIGAFEL